MKSPPPWKPLEIAQGADPEVKWIVARPNTIPIGDWVAGIASRSIVIINFCDPPLTWVRSDNPLFEKIKNKEQRLKPVGKELMLKIPFFGLSQ